MVTNDRIISREAKPLKWYQVNCQCAIHGECDWIVRTVDNPIKEIKDLINCPREEISSRELAEEEGKTSITYIIDQPNCPFAFCMYS
jgi:hypothetical protein